MTGFRVAFGGAQALLRRSRRTSPDSARSSAAACRPRRSAAAPTSCRSSRRSARSTRPARCSGNPLAMAAGLKAIEILARPGTYERLEQLGARLGDGLAAAAARRERPGRASTGSARCSRCSSRAGPVTDYATAKTADTARFGAFFRACGMRGVFLPPFAVRGDVRLARPHRRGCRPGDRRRAKALPVAH